jgi:hypothetical protein
VALNGFLSKGRRGQVHLLKVDTEGNELKVLEGARQALSEGRVEVIHFEFNEMNVVSHAFLRDFIDLLKGFRLFRLFPGGPLELGPYHAVTHEIFAYQNLVAVHRKSEFLQWV